MPTIFAVFISVKRDDMRRIVPDLLSELECDMVLAQVGSGLVVVPLKYHIASCIDVIVHTLIEGRMQYCTIRSQQTMVLCPATRCPRHCWVRAHLRRHLLRACDRTTKAIESLGDDARWRCARCLEAGDRIGRSIPHVVGLVGDLQSRGVGLKVLTGDIDTTTATSRLVFGIFATLADFECDLIHERTMAGLAAARVRGRAGERPRVMTKLKLKVAMGMMADRENAARNVAAQLGISLSTLYAFVDVQGQPRPRAVELLAEKRKRAIGG